MSKQAGDEYIDPFFLVIRGQEQAARESLSAYTDSALRKILLVTDRLFILATDEEYKRAEMAGTKVAPFPSVPSVPSVDGSAQ